MSSYNDCPACSSSRRRKTDKPLVFECKQCGAIYGDCTLGESYGIVRPQFTNETVEAKNMRYYDFMTIGSRGEERRHGWYDPATGLIVQIG